jgi:hypothetical protein
MAKLATLSMQPMLKPKMIITKPRNEACLANGINETHIGIRMVQTNNNSLMPILFIVQNKLIDRKSNETSEK